MSKRQLQQKIDTIVQVLVTKYDPEKIILFGSAVQGDITEDSDIDLLIIKDTTEDSLDRARQVYRLLWEKGSYNGPIDILVLTPRELSKRLWLGDPFYKEINTFGRQLFAKS